MKLLTTFMSAVLCAIFNVGAQGVGFKVTLPADSAYNGMRVLIQNISPESAKSFSELKSVNGSQAFAGRAEASPYGIYRIICSNSKYQYSLPVYVNPDDTVVALGMQTSGPSLVSSLSDTSNRALHAYQEFLTQKSIRLSHETDSMPLDEIKARLSSLITAGNSIVDSLKPEPQVAEFIRLWAYSSAFEGVDMANYLFRRSRRDMYIAPTDILPPPSTILDTPMAMAFMSNVLAVTTSLPDRVPVEQQLEALYASYRTPVIRSAVAQNLVMGFVNHYNPSDGMAEGEKRLASMIEKYSLPEHLMTAFKAKKVVSEGTPFPDVTLVDRDGNTVDFSRFRGKYVYVDLWASWCGPCCAEVPHLKKLEKDMAGSNVEFVSISLDSSRDSWIKKMAQLDMHGNQLLCNDDRLAQMLNVKGIPHFLVYDPEGRLLIYKAPRPSSEQILPTLKALGAKE